MITSGTLDINSRIGDALDITVAVKDSGGSNYDFTGDTVYLAVYNWKGDEKLAKTSADSEITLTSGQIAVVFDEDNAAISAASLPAGDYTWELDHLDSATGRRATWLRGDFTRVVPGGSGSSSTSASITVTSTTVTVTVHSVGVFTPTFASISEMEASAGAAGQMRFVSDIDRGGLFEWSASGSTDSGTVFTDGSGGYWKRVFQGAYNAKWFGAAGDGSTDDTAAVQAAAAAVQAAGGGKLLFPAGTYNVTVPAGSSGLMAFSSIRGLEIVAPEAVIADQQSYSSTTGILVNLTDCHDVALRFKVTTGTESKTSGYSNDDGLYAVYAQQGCTRFDVDIEMEGGLAAFTAVRSAGGSAAHHARQGRVRVKATDTKYPLSLQHSGISIDAEIETTDCGRNFFVYGVQGVRARIRSKNQQLTSIIDAFNGEGCENVRVDYYDRESDSCVSSSELFSLRFHHGATATATHRDIHLHLDVKSPAASPWGHTLTLAKYSDGASTADTTGRGHVIDGLRLSGVWEQQSGKSHVTVKAGAWSSPDEVRGLDLSDLKLRGSASVGWDISDVLQGKATVTRVDSDHNINIIATDPASLVFTGVRAANLSSGTGDTTPATYVGCTITGGGSQATDDSKTFIDCAIGAAVYNRPRNMDMGQHGTVQSRETASVSTSATAITSASMVDGEAITAQLVVVEGNGGGGNTFVELVLVNYVSTTATVVSSHTSGSPAARTYSSVSNSGELRLAMGSGTYNVVTLQLGLR